MSVHATQQPARLSKQSAKTPGGQQSKKRSGFMHYTDDNLPPPLILAIAPIVN